MKVAVTGGLACGKSSVCHFLKELGAYVVSADEIVHQLLSPHTSIGQQVITLLGPDIVSEGGIDRNRVAKKVFKDSILLHSLEQILHPAVLNEIEQHYQKALEEGKTGLFAAEIPLLYEINGEKDFDAVIAVYASPTICKERFKAATGYNEHEYERRAAQQLPAEIKAQRADYVIENKGHLEDTRTQVKHVYERLSNAL